MAIGFQGFAHKKSQCLPNTVPLFQSTIIRIFVLTSKIFPIWILIQYSLDTKMDKLDFPVFKTTKNPTYSAAPSRCGIKTVTPYLRHTNPTKGLSEFYPERILPMMNQTSTYCDDLLSIFNTIASIKEKITERNNVPSFLPKRPSPYSYFALLV